MRARRQYRFLAMSLAVTLSVPGWSPALAQPALAQPALALAAPGGVPAEPGSTVAGGTTRAGVEGAGVEGALGGAAGAAVPERATRLRVGDFAAPAPGVRVTTAPPAGAPFAEGARPPARDAAVPRTLVLRRPVTPGFSAVGVTWDRPRAAARCTRAVAGTVPCSGARVSVAVRVHREGSWSGWRAAGPADNDRDDPGVGARAAARPVRDGAELQWWGPADGLEAAISVLAGRPPTGIAVDLIDPGRRPGDAMAAAQPPAAAGGAPAAGGAGGREGAGTGTAPAGPGEAGPQMGPEMGPEAGPGAAATRPGNAARAAAAMYPYTRPRVPMPLVVRRAGWGADERKMGWTPEYVPYLKAATIHHTATTNDYTAAQVPAIVRSIYHFHAVSRDWGDIGYNVLVDRFGRLWEGRAGGLSRPVVGAHSGGYNSYTTGVAFIGDYRGRAVPARAREAAARFLAWKFSLSPAFDPRGTTTLTGGGYTSRYPPGTTIRVYRIHGHRRTNATECPGAGGVAALGPLRERTAALLGGWMSPIALRTRLTVWRAPTASWHVGALPGPLLRGARGDLPVAVDVDGDGTADLTTYNPAARRWTLRFSLTRRTGVVTIGGAGQLPAAADYNGDGVAELMTWEPATGLWRRPTGTPIRWGPVGDGVPVPADYTGDGRADLAVWQPATGVWWIRGLAPITLGDRSQQPVPTDHNGDGRVEPATWSPATHRFTIYGRPALQFGTFGEIAVPGQYDGDVFGELAVWGVDGRGVGRWLIEGMGGRQVGVRGDRPVPVY